MNPRLTPITRRTAGTAAALLLAAAGVAATAPPASAVPATVFTPGWDTSKFPAGERVLIQTGCHTWNLIGWNQAAGWHAYDDKHPPTDLFPAAGEIYTGGRYNGYTDKGKWAGLPQGTYQEYDARGYATRPKPAQRGTARLVRVQQTGAVYFSPNHYDGFRQVTDCNAQ
ncbi:hypothetical protein ACGF07_12310 [Kitasatospora sp. NPDC048194]|uniref:hypothetical protein n=1 Tax=Kitasatospora sp. NPDC048194 TaxID=3364045 RepID=UPI00370FC289